MNSTGRSVWLPGIVGLALVLRLLLFSGIQGNDDSVYFAGAQRFARGEGLSSTDLLQTRVAYVVPLALLFRIFGPGPLSLALQALAASLALVVLAHELARVRFGERTARGAALFVAFLPLDLVYATQANTDGPLASWLAIAAFLLLRAPDLPTPKGKILSAVLAGAALGAAHLTKESAVLLSIMILPLVASRANLRWIGAAAGTLAAIVAVELAVYQHLFGDAFHRIHVSAAIQSSQETGRLLARLPAAPSLCFDPTAVTFPYTAGFFAVSAVGCAWTLWRDRARSGGLAAWWLGSLLLLTLLPLRLQPRMFEVLTVPGAILAARFGEEVLLPRLPRGAQVLAAGAALFALACSLRIHQDALRWRRGPEWAHAELSRTPGLTVVTDSRTTMMLRMLSGDAPPYALRRFEASDPPPPPGTLLLYGDRSAAASRDWDRHEPPPWWAASDPPRETVAELRQPGAWRLRGPRGAEELTILRRVTR
ncbi:MAG: glycosyltransferase family 39 protein [Planctomycetes bacterium]|nr:glycosyltransferase family 39 protein [Planctomycetota bacterium]